MPVYWKIWSKACLLDRPFLWMMLVINGAGTVYGYIWYGEQLKETWLDRPFWQVFFVPDSPTASLFFTCAIMYLLFQKRTLSPSGQACRSLIEALAVVTSFKYGIWAVAMIAAGGWQGNELHWQHGMLIVSHLGMAVEVILYARFFTYGKWALLVTAIWTLSNDFTDYHLHLFPWLPNVLDDDLGAIRLFTMVLSVCGLLLAWTFSTLRRSNSV